MPLTNFPNGITSFGVPIYGGGGPIGLGMGDLYYVVTARTSANLYYAKLKSNGVGDADIFTTVALAYAATTAGQNDVVAVTPGAYLETAELAWSKDATHMVGLGGPNIAGDYTEANVVIYTSGIAVASTLTVTGKNCQFFNFVVSITGANTACLAAATVNSYGTYWNTVGFQGNMNSTINAAEASASLYIGAAGMYPTFDNCYIGQDVWGVRTTADQGVVRFVGNGRPNGGMFRECRFRSVSEDVNCVFVAMPAATSCGRGWKFDNCTFENFASTGAGDLNLNQVFHTFVGVQQDQVFLHHCAAYGVDAWADDAYAVILSDMAVPAVTGGLGIEPT